ncbi:MAG: PadR family transcriptional regulator [Gammaproteobacteria bacterium]|nr:PadR family transcriptional regulator [Gammaproteobacteria bacterium]
MNEIEQKWLSQLRKGFLEMCVMTILREQESAYGFSLLQQFQAAGMEVNEGTLYPLLNRMHKNGWLDSVWETPVDGGHPRRFYSLSKTGTSLLPVMIDIFQQQQDSLNYLLEH